MFPSDHQTSHTTDARSFRQVRSLSRKLRASAWTAASILLAGMGWDTADAQKATPTGGATPPALSTAAGSIAAQSGSSPQDFHVIKANASTFFRTIPGYQQNDLLTAGVVNQALEVVELSGWEIPDRRAILERSVPEASFMARELNSPAGRKFMRRIARHPSAYGRFDRLSTIAGGQALIRDLMRKKDGYLLIEYLTTTKGGQNLGHMAAATRNGVDLNKPTGRIYTEADFIAALEKQFNATTKGDAKAAARRTAP